MEKYKFTIIYSGNEPLDRQDGEIEFLGLKKDYEYHANAIYDYIKENYSHIKAFENIKPTLHVESASFALTMLGSIIFINTTPISEKAFEQYGYMGLLMLPNTLSENQRTKLLDFLTSLEEYNLEILYDLSQSSGVLDGKTIRKEKDYSGEVVSNFIADYGKVNKSK